MVPFSHSYMEALDNCNSWAELKHRLEKAEGWEEVPSLLLPLGLHTIKKVHDINVNLGELKPSKVIHLHGKIGAKLINDHIPIIAMSGYQRKGKKHYELLNLVEDTMQNGNRTSYVRQSLSGALDIYKKGGHVTMRYSEVEFKTVYDCRRRIITPIKEGELIDTEPFRNASECRAYKSIMTGVNTTKYHKFDTAPLLKPIKDTLVFCKRVFLRGVIENRLGLTQGTLGGLENLMKLLVDCRIDKSENNYRILSKPFKLKTYERKMGELLKTYACLKRKGKFIPKCIPYNEVSSLFVLYIKEKIPEFDIEEFLQCIPNNFL